VALSLADRSDRRESPIEDDEEVVFFPTFGWLAPEGGSCVLQVHGWIFEPEADSALRNAGLNRLRRLLGLEENATESAVFNERAGRFLVDNERGKDISVRLGGKCHAVGVSNAAGHFQGTLHVSANEVTRLQAVQRTDGGWLRFRAVTREEDARAFVGRVQLIGRTGISVVSDIDDTIKVSEVADREALLRNTFHRPFQAVSGMAEVYRSWAAAGARFHYVSASPWQLYEPLSAFLQTKGFPAGSFHLKRFRLKDSTALDLFASPEAFKLEHIEPILVAFPERRFVLVGDSGEKDPEIYGTLARKYSEQIVRIFIRDVSVGEPDASRFRRAFVGVPDQRWAVFRTPDELGAVFP